MFSINIVISYITRSIFNKAEVVVPLLLYYCRLKSIGMNPSDYPKIQKLALEIEDSIFLRQAVAKLVAYSKFLRL